MLTTPPFNTCTYPAANRQHSPITPSSCETWLVTLDSVKAQRTFKPGSSLARVVTARSAVNHSSAPQRSRRLLKISGRLDCQRLLEQSARDVGREGKSVASLRGTSGSFMTDITTVPGPSQHCTGSALAQNPPHMQILKLASKTASGHGSLRKGGAVPVQPARPCRTAGARWRPARASGCPAPSRSSACARPLPGPACMIVLASARTATAASPDEEPATAAAAHADKHAVSQRRVSCTALKHSEYPCLITLKASGQ